MQLSDRRGDNTTGRPRSLVWTPAMRGPLLGEGVSYGPPSPFCTIPSARDQAALVHRDVFAVVDTTQSRRCFHGFFTYIPPTRCSITNRPSSLQGKGDVARQTRAAP